MANSVVGIVNSGDFDCTSNFNNICGNDGFRALSFADLFFNRIHVLPPTASLGLIPQQGAIFNFELLNTFDIDITVEDVIASNAEGIILNVEPGDVLEAGRSRFYTATINSEGDEEFNSTFDFFFNNGAEQVTLTIEGTREPGNEIWPFRWNWNSGVTTFDRFKTDIISSYSGREQRISLKDFTDKLFTANYLVNRIDMEKAFYLSSGWAHKQFQSPQWHRRTVVVERAEVGQEFIIVDNATALRAGLGQNLYLLINDRFSGAQVVSIEGNTINLKNPLFQDVEEGVEVVASSITRFQDQPQITHLTDETSSISATFVEDEQLNVEPVLPSFDGIYLDGLPVFPFKEDMNQEQASAVTLERDGFVGDGGFEEIVYKGVTPYITASRSFTLDGNKPWSFLSFFNDVAGRQGAFWFELLTNSFTLKDDINENDVLLRFENNKFFELLKDRSNYKKVVITLLNNEKLILDVNGVDKIGGDSVLRVSAPGRVISRVEVSKVSLLMLARFATDDLRLTWLTDNIATVSMTIKTLIDEEGY